MKGRRNRIDHATFRKILAEVTGLSSENDWEVTSINADLGKIETHCKHNNFYMIIYPQNMTVLFGGAQPREKVFHRTTMKFISKTMTNPFAV